MTDTQSYFVDFMRFTKGAPYLEGVGTNKPCFPANCKCCYWKPVWENDYNIDGTDSDLSGISVLAY